MKDKILLYQAAEHYDLLATIHPDPPILQKYMAQWDGPMFFEDCLKPIDNCIAETLKLIKTN